MYLSIKLTLKQKKFADEYIISGNATDAAIKAGYSKKTSYSIGQENLKKPEIKKYLNKKIKELEDKKIAKQEEVLQYLTSVLRGESKSTIVVVEGCGDGYSEARAVAKNPDEKERLKAAELLGKRYGLWSDKTELENLKKEKLKVDIEKTKIDMEKDDIDNTININITRKEVSNGDNKTD